MKLTLELDLSNHTLETPQDVQTAINTVSRSLLEQIPHDALLGEGLRRMCESKQEKELVLAEMCEPVHKSAILSPNAAASVVARFRFVPEPFDNAPYAGHAPVRREYRDGRGELITETSVEL